MWRNENDQSLSAWQHISQVSLMSFCWCPMDCGLSCLEGITECIKSVSFKWRARFFCCVKHYSLFGSSMGFIDWFHTVETWPLADVWGPATTPCDPQSRQLSPCYVDQGVLISDKIQKKLNHWRIYMRQSFNHHRVRRWWSVMNMADGLNTALMFSDKSYVWLK